MTLELSHQGVGKAKTYLTVDCPKLSIPHHVRGNKRNREREKEIIRTSKYTLQITNGHDK